MLRESHTGILFLNSIMTLKGKLSKNFEFERLLSDVAAKLE